MSVTLTRLLVVDQNGRALRRTWHWSHLCVLALVLTLHLFGFTPISFRSACDARLIYMVCNWSSLRTSKPCSAWMAPEDLTVRVPKVSV